MADSYGILSERFWDGDTGRAIQEQGMEATILALFLTSNRWANMIGLYELPLESVAVSLPCLTVGARFRGPTARFRVITATLSRLDSVGFSHFDAETEVVWVREMARIRLNLIKNVALSEKDKRRIGAVKLYERIRPNRWLAGFYQRYHVELGLTRRAHNRSGSPDTPSDTPSLYKGDTPSDTPSIPLPKPVSVSVDQYQVRTTPPPTAAEPTRPVEMWKSHKTETSSEPPPEPGDHSSEPLRPPRLEDLPPMNPGTPRRGAKPAPATEPNANGNYRVIVTLAKTLLEAGYWEHAGERFAIADEKDLRTALKDECARLAIGIEDDGDRSIVARASAAAWGRHAIGKTEPPR